MTDFHEHGDPVTLKHRSEFGEAYDLLKFVSKDEARKAEALREEILGESVRDIVLRNKRTKPVYRGISQGCEYCGTGSWSCLFINGRCNCRCFYCPTEQRIIGLPTTNTLTFPRTQEYVSYINQLDFRGVSISGGEPLLTLEVTVKYISAIRRNFGDRVYLWIYTNGTLVDYDILSRLRDAGLDEIRFDIGATEYSLKKVSMAVGLIKHVTVEIPAVPDDYGRVKDALHTMSENGVSFLNLHQLRLTPHNRPNLTSRDYTYLHGEHITVLESELTALKLMRHASENRIPLSINYCSFVYKNRFQRAAARRRCAPLIMSPYEDITENGYIRSLYVKGPADVLGSLAESLKMSGCRSDKWHVKNDKERIFFSAAVWHHISFDAVRLGVAYFDSRLVPALSYRNLFREIHLTRNRSIFVERSRVTEDMEISGEQRNILENLIIKGEEGGAQTFAEAPLDQILQYETVVPDLQKYA